MQREVYEMNEKTQKILKWVGIYVALTLVAFVAYYLVLPPLHLQSTLFWHNRSNATSAQSFRSMRS